VQTFTRLVYTILTVVVGGVTGWLYYRRTTFDEPLFFILEFIVNLPLIISFLVFLTLLSFTLGQWFKR
jgi:ABC-type dipeptide/oligopeptide/nickel transport system permease subunit